MGYYGKEVCSATRETVMVVLLIISSNSLIFGAFGQEVDDPFDFLLQLTGFKYIS